MPTVNQSSFASVTPLNVKLVVTAPDTGAVLFDTTSVASGIKVQSVHWTLRVNNVSEASVAIAVSADAGAKKIAALTPRQNESGIQLAKAELTLVGVNTAGSLFKQDRVLFIGYIIGISRRVQFGRIEVVLNLKGPGFIMQNTGVLNPGFHTSAGYDFGFTPLNYSNDRKLNSASNLYSQLADRVTAKALSSGQQVFTDIVTNFFQVLKTFSSILIVNPQVAKLFQLFLKYNAEAALKRELAFLVNKTYPVPLTLFPILPGAPSTDSAVGMANALLMQLLQHAGRSFWELLLRLLEIYGLVITFDGKQLRIIPKLTLLPNAAGALNLTDVIVVEHGNFPFFVPTRIIVSIANTLAYGQRALKAVMGAYPSLEGGGSPTTQERAFGVAAIMYNTPLLSGAIMNSQLAAATAVATPVGQQTAAAATATATANVTTTAQPVFESAQQYADRLAHYYYLEEINKQRTCNVNVRLMPELWPGQTLLVPDPLGLRNIRGYLYEASSYIAVEQSQCGTTLGLNHCYYDGEFASDTELYNPFYPGVGWSQII